MGKKLTIFAVIVVVFWTIMLCMGDQFRFSRPFLLGSLTIIVSSAAALVMGLWAVRLEPLKAYPWIMGGLAVEMFIPLILVIYAKIFPNLLENSKNLVIMMKYFLAFFPVCLILEKTLVLRELHSKNTTDTKK